MVAARGRERARGPVDNAKAAFACCNRLHLGEEQCPGARMRSDEQASFSNSLIENADD